MGGLFIGFGLGLFVAAQIGPVSLLIVRSVLRGTLAIGLAMAAGVALVDMLYASLGLLGGARLIDSADGARTALGLVGAAVLIVLGAKTVWTGFRLRAGLELPSEVATPRRAFATAVAATALNPLTIALWAAAFPAAAAAHSSALHSGLLLTGVALGTLTWYSAFATAISFARTRVGPRLLKSVDVAAGAGVIGFGALLGYRSVH